MAYSTPHQLHFPPVAGFTVRGDCEGGALSFDFGPLLLRDINRQIGLTERLAAALRDKHHPASIATPCACSWHSASPTSPQVILTPMTPTPCATIPSSR